MLWFKVMVNIDQYQLFVLQLFLCEMILEQEGVLGYCDLDQVDLDLLPLDTDILSMETPEFFKSFYLVNNVQYIFAL